MTSNKGELKNGYIVNQNDMYLYFEIINQLEAKSVIDIGMFLKRIGAVSRQVKDLSLPDNIVIDGIDYMSDMPVKIYERIYNNIGDGRDFAINQNASNKFWDRKYDLAFLLRMKPMLNVKNEENNGDKIWKWLLGHVRFAVIDGSTDKVCGLAKNALTRELNVGNDTYSLVSLDR